MDLVNAYPVIQLPNSGYHTNNNYNNFPPFMQDGRAILASWGSASHLDKRNDGIQSNWQYRQYMTENSNQIRDKMFTDSLSDIGYVKQNMSTSDIHYPHTYASVHEPVSHYQAMPSDLRETYLTREQLQDRLVVPSVTQAELVSRWQQSAPNNN